VNNRLCLISRHGLSALLMLIMAGCGSKSPPATPTADTTGASPPAATASSPPPAPATTAAPAAAVPAVSAVDPKAKETKWIGNIPYDVFYDQPLNIAADMSMVAGATPSVAAASTGSTPPAARSGMSASSPPAAASPPAGAASPGTGTDWGKTISMAQLIEEIKILRSRLTTDLQTVATFNRSGKPIEVDAATLAALAAAVAVHPEAVNWKAQAHYVRDLAADVAANANGSGREAYMKAKEPFEKLTVILDGGKPPEMESDEKAPFADKVYVADMMKRIDVTFSSLKSNINTVARLKEDPAAVERDLRILALLGTMMGDHSYDNADEPKYKDLIARFVGGAMEGVQATKTGDFDGYQAALNKVQTTCAECHQEYRGGNSSF
jgi:hypothetical protein